MNGLTDVKYCFEGKHTVPAKEMVTLPGNVRKCCRACKERILELREKPEKRRP
jgi:hypothetical protein